MTDKKKDTKDEGPGEGTGGAEPTVTPDPFPAGSGVSPAPDATMNEASLEGVVPAPEDITPLVEAPTGSSAASATGDDIKATEPETDEKKTKK